jgi:hypothetical protein
MTAVTTILELARPTWTRRHYATFITNARSRAGGARTTFVERDSALHLSRSPKANRRWIRRSPGVVPRLDHSPLGRLIVTDGADACRSATIPALDRRWLTSDGTVKIP